MRQWIRSTRDSQTCGSCGETIPKGTPMVEVTIHGVRPLVRCATCSGLAVPEQLPEPIMPDLTLDPTEVRAASIARIAEQLGVRLQLPTTRPVFFPDLKLVTEAWSPFREDD